MTRNTRSMALPSILTLLLTPGVCLAYEEEGHFYTAAAVLGGLSEMTSDKARLVAFCAQMPDQVQELDAIEVYRLFPKERERRRMVTVQQLLHGLTGGKAQQIQAVAKQVVVERVNVANSNPTSENFCVLGLAIHLYADSFAHQQLDEATRDRMYPTGTGHAVDIFRPDMPIYSPRNEDYREREWERFVLSLAQDFAPAQLEPRIKQEDFPKVRKLVPEYGGGFKGFFSHYGKDELRHILAERLNQYKNWFPDGAQIFPQRSTGWWPFKHNETCMSYLARYSASQQFPADSLDCNAIWQRYREAASALFKARGNEAAVSGDYRGFTYDDSPLVSP